MRKIFFLGILLLLLVPTIMAVKERTKVYYGKVLVEGPYESVKITISTVNPSGYYETYTNKAGMYNIRVKWNEDILVSRCIIVNCIGGGFGGCSSPMPEPNPKPERKDYSVFCPPPVPAPPAPPAAAFP